MSDDKRQQPAPAPAGDRPPQPGAPTADARPADARPPDARPADARPPDARQPEEKVVEVYPAPEPELPDPTLKQYFLGWGALFLGLVAIAVLLGLLMRYLR